MARAPAAASSYQGSAGPSKAFELYVDGTKWLVAIAAGALAFGFDGLKDHAKGAAFDIFLLSAVALVSAIAAGLLYVWHSYEYASEREAGKAITDPKVKSTKGRVDTFFAALLWLFFASMVGFTGFSVVLLGELRAEPDDLTVTAPTDPNGPVVIASHRSHFWALSRSPKGYVWSELPPPLKPKD